MDLKELSESVQQQQQQGAQPSLTSPKRQIRSRFQLNLDKTIESCKAQLGQFINTKAIFTLLIDVKLQWHRLSVFYSHWWHSHTITKITLNILFCKKFRRRKKKLECFFYYNGFD